MYKSRIVVSDDVCSNDSGQWAFIDGDGDDR